LPQIVGLPAIGATQLGYYAVAVSVAEIPMVIAMAARTILLGGRSTGSTPLEATRIARIAVVTSALACAFLAAIAGFAVPFVFGRDFGPSVVPTVILCVATVLYTTMVLLTAVLLAHGKAKWSSAALVIGSVTSVAMIFALAPWGAIGASFASLAGYAASVAVAAWAVRAGGTPYTLRMLTLPYREDVEFARSKLARFGPGRERVIVTASRNDV
jgi:O-antigen/teichoic acid export membrane protein